METLKKTCEQCTKSKVRCSGPNTNGICDRCSQRKTECVFRTKLKRGPQQQQQHDLAFTTATAATTTKKKTLLLSSSTLASPLPIGISWHERRCWNVFFTAFKQQNRSDNPISWCWFALQLEKLRKNLVKTENVPNLQRLQAWIDSTHTKMTSLGSQVAQVCKFAPQLCVGCSSAAMSSRRLSPQSIEKTLELCKSTSKENFFCDSTHLEKPFLEFEMTSSSIDILQVNQPFINAFKHTRESLISSMQWSDGGFLPWGGDLMSRLLWSEADVLVFLQVLAVKFQALGPPKHDHDDPEHVQVREVLSAFVFDIRCQNSLNPSSFQERVRPCVLKVIHKETLQGLDLKINVLMEFNPLEGEKDGPETPESSKEALATALQRLPSAQQQLQEDVDKKEDIIIQKGNPTHLDDLALLDEFDWPTFENFISNNASASNAANSTEGNVEQIQEEESGEDDEETNNVEYEMKEGEFLSDEAWLSCLLDWSA